MGHKQDLATARAMLKTPMKSKDFATHCEARLGEDAIPSLTDFKSRDTTTIDKCTHFLGFVGENLDLIRYDLHDREAQPELPLGGDPEEKESALKEKLKGKAEERQEETAGT